MSTKRPKFAQNVFDNAKMKKYLPSKTFDAVVEAQNGKELPPCHAQKFANGLCKWAKLVGATRYALVLDPFCGGTVGKMHSWISTTPNGKVLKNPTAKQLLTDECDASAFGCGNSQCNAKGQIRWFAPLPAYVEENCLRVPATLSCNQTALDEKLPLFRSCLALDKCVTKLVNLLGTKTLRVFSVVGAEQEYFLVEKRHYLQRPDLVQAGKILTEDCFWGKNVPPNYCQAPHKKVANFWQQTERRLGLLGIVAQTQHNEVSPCQAELAPCCAEALVAYWQNQRIMQTLRSVADKQNLACLLHEKPFPHLSGSGKHNNWSLFCNGKNLFERGTTPQQHAQYAVLIACMVQAVSLHQKLLCLSAMSCGNDERLGQCEAPPQVISLSLGNALADLVEAASPNFRFGHQLLSPPQNAPRNRTSPLVLTQGKFEFRLVGACASIAACNTVLNAAFAETADILATQLQNAPDVWAQAQAFVADVLKNCGNVLFDGDNYSAFWQEEANRRKLFFAQNTPQAIVASKQENLLQKLKILSAEEQNAWHTAMLNQYCRQRQTQATVLAEMCREVLPIVNKTICFERKAEGQTSQNAPSRRMAKLLCCKKMLDSCAKQLSKQTERATHDVEQRAVLFGMPLEKTILSAQRWLSTARSLCPKNLWPLPDCTEILHYN